MPSGHNSSPPAHDASLLRNRRMLILYGSETGNSQELAEDLERLAERLRFETVLCEMNDVQLGVLLQYPLVVFVLSTTGQGDLPRNALKFWKALLRKRLPPNCLANLNFTTFGLGDSSYTKYNWAVRKLHKRLEQLGGTEFFPRGEADERHSDGVDGSFLPWSISLRAFLEKEYPLPEDVSPIPLEVQLPPKYTIELVPTMDPMDVEMPDGRTVQTASRNDAGPVDTAENSHDANTAVQDQQEDHRNILDRTAAQFSHVDTPNRELLQHELEMERTSPYSTAHHARLSDRTAAEVKGGIDILDRPNVLRDHPDKYSIEGPVRGIEVAPPDDRLPIPKAWFAVLKGNERVTPPEHWQDVRQLTFSVPPRDEVFTEDKKQRLDDLFNLEENEFCPVPGMAMTIYPKNFPEDVQALIDLMGWGDVADNKFEHRTRYDSGIFGDTPKNCYPLPGSTLRQLLMNNYDITSIPKRSFFEHIAFFTEDAMHQERLREFSNPGHSDEFYDYTSRPRRSILEVLHDFPSVRIPYQNVPSVFPVIRGREYSIASGGVLSEGDIPGFVQVEILVALVEYKTVLRKTRTGLCSRYMKSLPVGSQIHFTVRDNDVPTNALSHRRPLIAIGPGTGIAPIRSVIWERYVRGSLNNVLVFFGGRNRKADFYFEREWDKLHVDIRTAFSRDQREKIYVQDVIRESHERVCQLIRANAVVLLCGSSGKMPEAVKLALYDAMVLGKMAPDREKAKVRFDEEVEIWEEVW
ncbi:riboflavin synthase domain-like protein [Xylariaceae sp. FL0016]|nr:riboflavin synthase domain-like protein [Xylariaceae sp. FL0016]